MKRAFAVSLMVAVVATSLLGPAEAAKKKKKPKPPPAPVQVDAQYFLRRDGECGVEGATYLSLVDAPDLDATSCGNLFYGAPQRLPENGETTAPKISYTSRDGDGIPLTLDATKDVTGMIGVKSRSVAQGDQGIRIGAGDATLNVELTGTTGGEEKVIGTAAVDYTVEPGTLDQIYEVEFTLKPDAALDKLAFTSVKLTIWNSGDSVAHGFYTTDNPASYFKMGIWK